MDHVQKVLLGPFTATNMKPSLHKIDENNFSCVGVKMETNTNSLYDKMKESRLYLNIEWLLFENFILFYYKFYYCKSNMPSDMQCICALVRSWDQDKQAKYGKRLQTGQCKQDLRVTNHDHSYG